MENYTNHGLEKSYRRLFEKAGWKLIALKSGDIDKVQSYLLQMTNIAEEIKRRLDESSLSKERSEDFERMYKNLMKLDGVFQIMIQTVSERDLSYSPISSEGAHVRKGAQYMYATKHLSQKDSKQSDKRPKGSNPYYKKW